MMEVYRINISKSRASSRKNRGGKAVRVLKNEVSRVSGVSDVRISNNLNERIWTNGGKPPKYLDVQLIEEDDHVIADVADSDYEKEEKAEKSEESEPEKEEEENSYDIPEDVQDVLMNGSIDEGKDAVKEMNKADFEKILNFEKAHKNRKGMKKFLRSNSR